MAASTAENENPTTATAIPFGVRVMARIIAGYLRFVFLSSRFQVIGQENLDGLIGDSVERGQGHIVAFWHGRLALLPFLRPKTLRFFQLISTHRDGEAIARAVHHLGFDTIRGSSRNPAKDKEKGGMRAARELVRLLRAGHCVGLTPDGPRGPNMVVSPGVIALARMAGAPITPVTYAISRRRLLRSWDRFVFPLPFSRGVFIVDEPITVPRRLDDQAAEQFRSDLQDRLLALTRRADRMVGQQMAGPRPAVSGTGRK